jgi:hypothetical protein
MRYEWDPAKAAENLAYMASHLKMQRPYSAIRFRRQVIYEEG